MFYIGICDHNHYRNLFLFCLGNNFKKKWKIVTQIHDDDKLIVIKI